MSTAAWVTTGVVVYLVACLLFVISLCRAAGRR